MIIVKDEIQKEVEEEYKKYLEEHPETKKKEKHFNWYKAFAIGIMVFSVSCMILSFISLMSKK